VPDERRTVSFEGGDVSDRLRCIAGGGRCAPSPGGIVPRDAGLEQRLRRSVAFLSTVEPTPSASKSVAAAWERYRERLFSATRPVSDSLVSEIDPRPGQTVLELAAGPGETGFLVAERVGELGRVISSDLDPDMVDAARRGADARGLKNVEFRLMDAQDIDLPEESIDAVVCRFGIMLVSDPATALAGVRRVLRPRGRLAYAVIGRPDENPWLSMMGVALVQSGHQLPFDPLGPGGPFSLADVDADRAFLEEAGFSAVTVDQLAGRRTYRDFDEYWEMQSQLSGPIAVYLASLDAAGVAEVRRTLERLVQPLVSGVTFSLPWNVVVAAGTA
jgi:SAM-dependent methyltransferase